MTKKIFFSIIIPAKANTHPALLKICLTALRKQSYKNFEVIIVTPDTIPHQLHQSIKREKIATLIQGNYGKSAARNIGTKHATGNYLLHIDVDYVLHPTILALAVSVIKKTHTKAIILHERIAAGGSIWQQARALERNIVVDDLVLSAPQLIEKKLFERIGGFDERVDALDDWGIALKLAKMGIIPERIPPLTQVYEPTNFFTIWQHRFHKGRYLPILKKIYGDIPQTDIRARWESYHNNGLYLLKHPHITAALGLLKCADLIPFLLGTLFPIHLTDTTDIYQHQEIARQFDTENKRSQSAAYKQYRETGALLTLLGSRSGSILELGAGTGRITQLLTKKGWPVLPTDISPAMLSQLQKKKGLPTPQLITTTKLPFRKNKFAYVIAMRVIWHIMDDTTRELFLAEAIRTAKRSVIMDFTNKQKYNNFFLRFFLYTFSPSFFNQSYYFTLDEIQKLAKKNNAVIEEIIPLEVLPPVAIPVRFFPLLAKAEILLSRIIPPGRFMIKLTLQ